MASTSNLASLTKNALTLVLAAGLLAGCASSGSGDAGAAGQPKTPAVPLQVSDLNFEDYAKLGYRLEWTGFATVTTGQTLGAITPLGDVVVARDSGGAISLLSAAGGEVKWATVLSTPLTRYLGMLRDGRRIIACSDSELFFLDIDGGTLLARQPLSKVVNTAPAQYGPVVIAGSAAGEIQAHLTTTGVRAWLTGVGGLFESSPVSLDGGRVGFVSQNGMVIILNASDGTSTGRWRMASGVTCDPCGDGETMYVASTDQSIYAFPADGGPRPKWRRRTDSVLTESPAFYSGKVYVNIPSSGFTALDSETGSPVWTTPGVSGRVVAVNKGKLVVYNGETAVTMDALTGDILERVQLAGISDMKPDIFVDGNLYVTTPSGVVHKFRQR